jgi:class 3 adenylate cyclase
MGDGVLAYFGFPRAHEDDAARAVHAGLETADAVAALQMQRASSPLLGATPRAPASSRISAEPGAARARSC